MHKYFPKVKLQTKEKYGAIERMFISRPHEVRKKKPAVGEKIILIFLSFYAIFPLALPFHLLALWSSSSSSTFCSRIGEICVEANSHEPIYRSGYSVQSHGPIYTLQFVG